ncbi:MAG: YybS family protein [Thermodesulfobacteriota bacterium]|nr:YybS family protein [Thermodesulfobacteriota bacterium]
MPQALPKHIISGVAVTSLIVLTAIYFPLIGFLCFVALPLAAFYYRATLGRANGLMIPAVSMGIILAVLGGVSPDILIVMELLILGFVLGECVEKRLRIEQIFLYTSGIVFFIGIFTLLVYSNLSGTQMGTLLSDYVSRNLQLSLKWYTQAGAPKETILVISESMDAIHNLLIRVLPAIATAFIMFSAWVTFLLARSLLTKKGLYFPDVGNLKEWKAPEHLVWGVIGCGALLLLPAGLAKTFGQNLIIILMMIYFFQGIAIVSFYFEQKQFPLALRIFLYSILFIWHLMVLFVVGLGFFDMWADFRRLNQPPPGTDDDNDDGFME